MMLKSLGILLIAAVILWIEVPPLLKKKQKKELLVFSILLTVGIVLSMTLAFGKPILNPLEFLTFIFTPIVDVMSRLQN